MKPTDINDIKGDTLSAKLETLFTQYPKLYAQEKVNGIGFRVCRTDRVCIYTTRNKIWPPGFFQRIELELAYFLAGNPGTVYGEFIARGVSLADLGGAISVNRLERYDPRVQLKAMVYDVFDDNRPKAFSNRIRSIDWHGNDPIWVASTIQVTSPESAVSLFNKIVADGGEGIILRADPCFVGPGISPQMWKVKRIHDMEGRCFGVTEGLGKRKGMLGAFVVRLANGQSVSVGGGKGLTDAQLLQYFHRPPIGKMITFSYEEMSAYGIPLRCQFIAVRDYE